MGTWPALKPPVVRISQCSSDGLRGNPLPEDQCPDHSHDEERIGGNAVEESQWINQQAGHDEEDRDKERVCENSNFSFADLPRTAALTNDNAR
jgi:hypothetical protein